VERFDQLGADLQGLVEVLDLTGHGDHELLAQLLQTAEHPQLGIIATLTLHLDPGTLVLLLHDVVQV